MRALLLWHAAEEIEHRSVAFDVLAQMEPSYALRMAGLVLATATLSGFWIGAATMLLWQDRKSLFASLRKDLQNIAAVRDRNKDRGLFLPGILSYLRRDFHPSRVDLDKLAQDYLTAAQLA